MATPCSSRRQVGERSMPTARSIRSFCPLGWKGRNTPPAERAALVAFAKGEIDNADYLRRCGVPPLSR